MNIPKAPLVSIVIPSFNQGRYIRETLQSCLDQDYRPIEVLVLDGGSRDETVSVLKQFYFPELVWWSEPDDGVTDGVNKGLIRAQGDILTIQSSDDVFLPGALSAAVKEIVEHPEVGLVYGDVKHINGDSVVIGEDVQDEFDLAEYLGRFMYIPQPGTCFTRAALRQAGEWNKSVSYVADADFWFRIVTHFPVRKLDQFLAGYRYHPEQRDTHGSRIAGDWERAVLALLRTDTLNGRQKRFARMGIHLAGYRYCSAEAWVRRTFHLYKALLANPVAVSDKRFPKRELFPGRTPIWSLLSRVKRGLGFKPRSS